MGIRGCGNLSSALREQARIRESYYWPMVCLYLSLMQPPVKQGWQLRRYYRDWTPDENSITLEGWEGFLAIWKPDEERWQLYFDHNDDGCNLPTGTRGVEISLRSVLSNKHFRQNCMLTFHTQGVLWLMLEPSIGPAIPILSPSRRGNAQLLQNASLSPIPTSRSVEMLRGETLLRGFFDQ